MFCRTGDALARYLYSHLYFHRVRFTSVCFSRPNLRMPTSIIFYFIRSIKMCCRSSISSTFTRFYVIISGDKQKILYRSSFSYIFSRFCLITRVDEQRIRCRFTRFISSHVSIVKKSSKSVETKKKKKRT